MNLYEKLEEMAGLDVFGVADAIAYGEKAPPGHRPADFLEEFPFHRAYGQTHAGRPP